MKGTHMVIRKSALDVMAQKKKLNIQLVPHVMVVEK